MDKAKIKEFIKEKFNIAIQKLTEINTVYVEDNRRRIFFSRQ